MLSSEVFLLFLNEIFCCQQNIVFLPWHSAIVIAKIFFVTLDILGLSTEKGLLENNKVKIFAVDIPRISK